MNIFVVDNNPVTAAKMLCDKHIVKMPLESAQMASAVAIRHGYNSIYRLTHKNHPCTLWAGDTYENWLWLMRHGKALCQEYTLRYGKTHKCEAVLDFYLERKFCPPDGKLTNHALAMPDKYIVSDSVESYRNYYVGEKQFFKNGSRPTWKPPSQPPYWWEYK